jgi:hypothetical protein
MSHSEAYKNYTRAHSNHSATHKNHSGTHRNHSGVHRNYSGNSCASTPPSITSSVPVTFFDWSLPRYHAPFTISSKSVNAAIT